MKKAKLVLSFEDGSEKVIELVHAIELDISSERKQSIEFRQLTNGNWVMAYTKPILDGKKLKNLAMEKLNN